MGDSSRWKQGAARLGGALLVMWLAVLAATPAWAQQAQAPAAPVGPKPKVFMLPTQSVQDSITSIVPERIGELLRQQVRQNGRVVLMPTFQEIRDRLGGAGHSSAAIAEAEGLYTSGIGLLTAGEDKEAVESFQRALELMEANLADLKNYDVLADTLANLALASFNAGFDLDARKRIKEYAHLRPDATLDPEKFPKDLRSLFDEEARKVKKAKPGELEITSATPGASVLIDGVDKGVTPVTVEDVGYGHHYLVVRGPGGSVWSEKIRVRGRGKAQSFEAELAAGAVAAGDAGAEGEGAGEEGQLPGYYTDLVAAIGSGSFGTDLQPYLAELSTQTGAQLVAWVVMYKKDGQYIAAPFVYGAEEGLFVRAPETSFNIELSNLLVGVRELSESLVATATTMPEDQAFTSVTLEAPVRKPVAAAPTPEPTATGRGAEVAARSPYRDAPIQAPPEATPSESGGDTWKYVAIGGGGIAAAALIVGGIVLFADDSNPAAAGGFDAEVAW